MAKAKTNMVAAGQIVTIEEGKGITRKTAIYLSKKIAGTGYRDGWFSCRLTSICA